MSDKNLTALKTLVISMGVVLIVGFLVVGASVWMKLKGAPGAMAAAGRGLPANCPGGTVDLKGRGHVADTAVEGQVMRFALINNDNDLEMVHIDLCTGKEINTVKIITDAEPATPFAPPAGMGMSTPMPEHDPKRDGIAAPSSDTAPE